MYKRHMERLEALLSDIPKSGITSLDPDFIVIQPCRAGCGRETNLTFPHCRTCTRKIESLDVRKSSLGIEAFFGLFAVRSSQPSFRSNSESHPCDQNATPVFELGDVIAIYNGEFITPKQHRRLIAENRIDILSYVIEIQTSIRRICDGSKTSSGVARYINDPGDASKCNAKYIFADPKDPFGRVGPRSGLVGGAVRSADKRVVIVATRRIYDGEEVFMPYNNEAFVGRKVVGETMRGLGRTRAKTRKMRDEFGEECL